MKHPRIVRHAESLPIVAKLAPALTLSVTSFHSFHLSRKVATYTPGLPEPPPASPYNIHITWTTTVATKNPGDIGSLGEKAFYRLAEEGLVACSANKDDWMSFKVRTQLYPILGPQSTQKSADVCCNNRCHVLKAEYVFSGDASIGLAAAYESGVSLVASF